MAKNNYYEDLIFQDGKKINVSDRIDPGFRDMLHWHTYAELLVSLCDDNEVTVNFVNYRLKTNDIVFVCSGSPHAVRCVTEKTFLVIQFPPELLTVINEFKPVVTALSGNPMIVYEAGTSENSEILYLLSRIRELYRSGTRFEEAYAYSLLLRVFGRIGQLQNLADGSSLPVNDKTEAKNTALIAEACLYISENCTRQITVDEVSHQIGMSRSHFSHLFRVYTNKTFVEFLTAERVKRAEAFFLDPKMRIVDVAFESGFSSISSFNRAFRRIKGCTPSEFRRTRVD